MRGGKYQVQVFDGAEWHAITKPVMNKRVALRLAESLNEAGDYTYRAFNRYVRRETFA